MLTFVGMAGALAGAGQTKVEPLKTCLLYTSRCV